MESDLGYRQNYEGTALYIFRHPHRENKWFAMTLQNQGTRSALRLENQMYSGLRNLNHCELDMEKGVRTGVRLILTEQQVETQVKDSDDVSYRACAKQAKINKNWDLHHFAVAAKNSVDDNKEMMITDLDVDSVQIKSLRPWEMESKEWQADERNYFLLRRHSKAADEDGEGVFDVSRLFELNLAHDLAQEQKKTLNFVDEDDEFEDLLFKHHQMLKRVEFNFGRFNDQLEQEIRDEEDYEQDLISSAQLTEAQKQLEELYSTADELKESLQLILEDSRTTLDQILAKENLDKSKKASRGNFDPAQVKLNPQIMDSLDAAHKVLDTVISNT